MLRLAVLVWILAGTVLAGGFVTVVLSTPSLLADGMRLIPILGVGGYLVAMPLSWIIAERIAGATAARA